MITFLSTYRWRLVSMISKHGSNAPEITLFSRYNAPNSQCTRSAPIERGPWSAVE